MLSSVGQLSKEMSLSAACFQRKQASASKGSKSLRNDKWPGKQNICIKKYSGVKSEQSTNTIQKVVPFLVEKEKNLILFTFRSCYLKNK